MLIHLLALPFAFAPTLPDTIFAGHPALRSATLPVGTDTTEIFVVRDGQRQMISTGVQKVTQTGSGILVVYESQTRRGPSLDSITIAPGTFAPTRHVEVFADKRATLAFRDGRLTGTSTDSAGTHAVDVAVPANRLDFSVMSLITRTLPPKIGYEAVMMTYDVALMKERAITYRIVAEERIVWRGGEVPAWKTVTDFGTHQVTRWMDARTRRDLQWEIKAPTMHMVGVTR